VWGTDRPGAVPVTAVSETASGGERFSVVLRALTQDVHRQAESTVYIEDLLAGRLDRGRYAELVAQLWHVYRLLESASEVMRDDRLAGPFVFDELARVPSLEVDLAYLYGPDWVARAVPLESTRRYCDRLTEVAFSDPARFVAHHYTRYLGDLSGGQVIGAAARRIYGFDDSGGAEFYRFPDTLDPDALKARYRYLLDSTDWPAADRQRLADEVLVAYGLNTDLLVDLGGDVPVAERAQS
jgi:heme oxygenase (biliverdin-producing, ferredoxin)